MSETAAGQRERQLWVIFDICTISDYYGDPLNIIALPKGAVYRYDYQESHFSTDALSLARAVCDDAFQLTHHEHDVVLVYAQAENFAKGATTPTQILTKSGGVFISFRLAKLRRLTKVKRGATDRFYFDMEMGAYPIQPTSQSLDVILEPLIEARQVPYPVLVATSHNWEALGTMGAKDSSEGFGEIIKRLGCLPSQFAGDSFWRITGARETNSGDEILPTLFEEIGFTSGVGQERRLDWRYEFDELSQILLEIEAQEPNENRPAVIGQRDISFNVTGPVKELLGLSRDGVTLRRYGIHDLSLSVYSSNSLRASSGELSIRTKRPEPGAQFPTGAEVRIKLKIGKNPERAKGALLCIAVGAVAALVAGIAPLEIQWRITATVITFFATLAAGLLWAGTVPFFGGSSSKGK